MQRCATAALVLSVSLLNDVEHDFELEHALIQHCGRFFFFFFFFLSLDGGAESKQVYSFFIVSYRKVAMWLGFPTVIGAESVF